MKKQRVEGNHQRSKLRGQTWWQNEERKRRPWLNKERGEEINTWNQWRGEKADWKEYDYQR